MHGRDEHNLASMQGTLEYEKLQTGKLHLFFEVDELDRLVRTFLPGMPVLAVGKLFGFEDNSSWSLYRNGRRPITLHIVARSMQLFPNVPTQTYTVIKPHKARS